MFEAGLAAAEVGFVAVVDYAGSDGSDTHSLVVQRCALRTLHAWPGDFE